MEVNRALQTLWIDGVGGFGIWNANSIEIGRSVEIQSGVSILGDLASRSARLERSGEEWMLYPIVGVSKNGVKVVSPTLVQHSDRIQLGSQVELLFEQVNPWTSTAKLRILSRHRWADPMDGILLVGQTCLLGPSPRSNILCREWKQNFVLFRTENAWMIRPTQVTLSENVGSTNNASHTATTALIVGQRIASDDYSLTLL